MGGSSAPPGDLHRKFNKKTKRELLGERNQTMALMRTELMTCKTCVETWQTAPDRRRQDLDQAINRLAGHLAREEDYTLRQRWEALVLKPAQRLALQARLLGGDHAHTQKVLRQTFEGFRALYREHRLWRNEVLKDGLEGITHEDRPLVTRKANHHFNHKKYAVEPKHFQGMSRAELLALYNQLVASKQLGTMTQSTERALLLEGVKQGLYLPRARVKGTHFEIHHRYLYLFYGFEVPRSTLEEWRILTSPQLIAARRKLHLTWHPDTAGHAIPPALQRHYFNILSWTWEAMKTRRKQLAFGLQPVQRHGHGWFAGVPVTDVPFDPKDMPFPPREIADLVWREGINRGRQLSD